MKRHSGRYALTVLSLTVLGLVLTPRLAHAQWGGTDRLDAFAAGARLGGPSWSENRGGAVYLPSGSFGGFVPYSPGPGQGLGVSSRGAMVMPRGLDSGMRMPSGGFGLGGPSEGLRPLTPIGLMGTGGMMGQGGMPGASSRRLPAGRGMPGMGRPPVGAYPFRIPPSLLGTGGGLPTMAM